MLRLRQVKSKLLRRFCTSIGTALVALSAAAAAPALVDQPAHGVRLAAGFRITQFAGEQLANDIWAMTFRSDGALLVSGPGYIKMLRDTDGDGVADEASLFAKHTGAMGLCYDRTGTQLLVMGGGWLARFADADLDGVADGRAENILPFAAGEHGGHAIRQGPDGWWYVIAGNDAGVDARHVTLPDSPITKVEAGALVRLSPDLKTSEVIAHGFRNPYDFDFNEAGDIFTYDSDTERDYFLPWYSGCRIYRVEPGRHHGWRLRGYQRSFRRPDYAPDIVPCLVDLGRGSPTGVVCYKATQFSERYRGGVFACDWTFGRIHFIALSSRGPSYEAASETFLEPIGTHGFAPTDCAVAPDGSLFVTIGGRKTRGSVYRIQWAGGDDVPSTAQVGDVPAREAPAPLQETPATEWDASRASRASAAITASRGAASALRALRQLQLALGDWRIANPSADAFAPYEAAVPCTDAAIRAGLADAVRPHLESTDSRVTAEAARLLAMLEDDSPAASEAVLRFITETSSPTSDFHYLAVAAKLRCILPEEAVSRIARAVLDLDRKLAGGDRRPKQMWPIRLTELVAAFVKRDATLAEKLIAAPGFATPARLPLVPVLGVQHEQTAARLFLAAASADRNFEWSPGLANLLRKLPAAEVDPLIREREPRLPSPEPVQAQDVARWEQTLELVPWERGDARRGEKIFRERACGSCHSGATPFGPDLAGAATRMSPPDLIRSIVFPSRDVAEAYRATHFTLRDGSSRVGTVAFHSADGVIIQTGPSVTERLPEADIASRAPSLVSLMPAGLLEGLTPEQIADLRAYLAALPPP